MKNEKETKAKLMASAKTEFLEKGYMQASLRNICKNAGVTTGALYFFFKDKEDLFESLVSEPLEILYDMMNQHYACELQQTMQVSGTKEAQNGDLEASREAIHKMYQYYDELQLVLTKGQGSGCEKIIDRFVEITEKHYRIFADRISEQRQIKKIDDCTIHWIAHMHIDSFVYILTHESSEEAALQHMESIVKYLTTGWYGMFQ